MGRDKHGSNYKELLCVCLNFSLQAVGALQELGKGLIVQTGVCRVISITSVEKKHELKLGMQMKRPEKKHLGGSVG